MSGHKFLSVSEAANFLHGTPEDVIRWVMEDRTLTAWLVSDHGSATSFELRGLPRYRVSDTGAVTDRFHDGRAVGNLRFDPVEVNRYLAEWSKAVAAAVPLTELLAETPAAAATGEGSKKWTPERLTELKTYRDAHGTKKAAERYGISGSRVRALLPSEKPRAAPFSSMFHRLK